MADTPQPNDGGGNPVAPSPATPSTEELGYSPAEVQKLLTKLGTTKNKKSANAYNDTLVPLLSHWLRDHHGRLEAYRKKLESDRKKGLSAQSSEQSDPEKDFEFLVEWILHNLASANVTPQPQDIKSLCEALCDICRAATDKPDIDSATSMLHHIAQLWPYPEPLLARTVTMFCRIRARFPDETPDKLLDSMKLLVHSKNEQLVLETLYSCAAIDDSTTDKHDLLKICGALATMRDLIHEKNEKDEFLLQFDRVVSIMSGCAKVRAVTLCTEILQLSGALLTEDERVRNSLQFKWADLMRCTKSAAKFFEVDDSKDDSAEQPPTAAAANAAAEFARNLALHRKAVAKLNLDLAGLMNSKPEITLMQMIYDYLLFYPEALTESACRSILRYVDDAGLCRPDARAWRWEIDQILKYFIEPPRWSKEVRKHAIKVLGHFFEKVGINPIDGYAAQEARARAYNTMRTVLLEQFYKTEHAEVAEGLIKVFSKARISSTDWNTIIERLAELLKNSKAANPASLVLARSAAKSLLSFVAHAAKSNPVAANAALQAMISTVGNKDLPILVRLSILRFLFAIRCDLIGTICVIEDLESQEIAGALNRSAKSLVPLPLEGRIPRDGLSSTVAEGPTDQTSQLWLYPEFEQLLPFQPSNDSNLYAPGHELPHDCSKLDTGSWLVKITELLQAADTDWETYSFIIVHLGAQLGNVDLFRGSLPAIIKLRQILCEQVREGKLQEPPSPTGLRKSDVAICMFHLLTSLIPYATLDDGIIEKAFADDLIKAFLCGIGGTIYDGTAKSCIHALSVCAFDTPRSVASQYPAIIDKMSKSITQSYLATDILEFLSQVARIPRVHEKFREEEITTVFGMCIKYLEQSREQFSKPSTQAPPSLGNPHRNSSLNIKRSQYKQSMMQNVGFSQGIAAMAYHTMIYLFLAVKLEDRGKFVSWIVPRLIGRAQQEKEVTEQTTVFIDMMQRAAYSDLGETQPEPAYLGDDRVQSSTWLNGLSIVTIQVRDYDGGSQIIKRQASGTTYALYKQSTAKLPFHHAPVETNSLRGDDLDQHEPIKILPPHVLLQMIATAAPVHIEDQALHLPQAEFVARALAGFDRIPIIDSHKIGVIYVGGDQTMEDQYLANSSASVDFGNFLKKLGTLVSIEDPVGFNPHSLQCPRDGEFTIAWRDRVAEIVFLITSMMPTNIEDDPHCTTKKMHVGNCHVNIIFNMSGWDWSMDYFRSQLNYVNIVISPANGLFRPELHSQILVPEFYRVQVLTRYDMPSISPVAESKVVSAKHLASFVRLLALNADVVCSAWNAKRDGDAEFPSSWRARLQAIKRLKSQVTGWNKEQEAAAAQKSTSDVGGGKKPAARPTKETKEDVNGLAATLDFGRWAS